MMNLREALQRLFQEQSRHMGIMPAAILASEGQIKAWSREAEMLTYPRATPRGDGGEIRKLCGVEVVQADVEQPLIAWPLVEQKEG